MKDLADYRPDGWLGQPYQYLSQTASTNDLAYAAGLNGTAEGALFITDVQHAGRGRFERTWSAPKGCCLLFSVLLRPQAPFACHANRLTMACGLAMQKAIIQVSGVAASIKWPNDLIVAAAQPGALYGKVAGMLSEIGLIEQSPAFLVVGMGVNVNLPAQALASLSPQAMSLSVASGKAISRRDLLDNFITECEALIETLRKGNDLLPLWRDALAWCGQTVTVMDSAGMRIHGTFEDVTDEGALRLRTASGEMRTYSAGDISLRLT